MVEVEKPLEGLPLANADQWSSPSVVAKHERSPRCTTKEVEEPTPEVKGAKSTTSAHWSTAINIARMGDDNVEIHFTA
jgi:hypothetical protein